MEITVIIPTFRPKAYLRECLDSLAGQTFPKNEFETIIVLNGPQNPFREQIEEYIDSISDRLDIKLLCTEQPGVSNARNMALEMAAGRFITFIDDDDFVSPEYLEGLHAKTASDTVVISRPYIFNDGDTAPLPYRSSRIFMSMSPKGRQSLLKTRKLMHITCMKMFPREMIGDRRFDTSFSVGEDTLMMFLISDRIRYADFTHDNAIYYRRVRKDSAVGNFSSQSVMQRARNSLRLISRYTGICLSGIGRYSFLFYLTRVWGAIHSIFRI